MPARRSASSNRFDADLKPMIAALPSYTQLGMAALLPNSELALSEDDGGDVIVVRRNRPKAQRAAKSSSPAGAPATAAKAMKAEDFMSMKADEGKELFRDHDILYLYHNRIDVIGDKLADGGRCPRRPRMRSRI